MVFEIGRCQYSLFTHSLSFDIHLDKKVIGTIKRAFREARSIYPFEVEIKTRNTVFDDAARYYSFDVCNDEYQFLYCSLWL